MQFLLKPVCGLLENVEKAVFTRMRSSARRAELTTKEADENHRLFDFHRLGNFRQTFRIFENGYGNRKTSAVFSATRIELAWEGRRASGNRSVTLKMPKDHLVGEQ